MLNSEHSADTIMLAKDNPPTAPVDAEVDVEVLKSIPKQFTIDREEHANWLVKKIVSARSYAERVKAWAEQEQRRAAREEQTLMFLFGRQIEAWARTEIERRFHGRRRSLALPAGTVGYRKLGNRLVVEDEEVVIGWARQHCPQAVVITEKLSKSVLDEHTRTTGVIPDAGVRIEPESDRFFVK